MKDLEVQVQLYAKKQISQEIQDIGRKNVNEFHVLLKLVIYYK